MAAPLIKTKTPGIFKRGSRCVFSYRVDGRQHWESCRTLDEARRAKDVISGVVTPGRHGPKSVKVAGPSCRTA